MTWVLALSAKSTLILLAALAVTLGLRRASAASRHAVWTLALVGLMALPVVSLVVPRLEVAVLPAPAPERIDVPRPTAPPPPAMAELGVPDDAPVFEPAAAASTLTARPAAIRERRLAVWLATWLGGVTVGLAQLALGTLLIARKARRARRVEDGDWPALLPEPAARLYHKRRVALRESAEVALPVVWGYLRPVILLPPDAALWPIERRRAFLLHELAHVARFDCFTQTLAYLVRALYWPHPLVWWAVSRLRREAERACDDRVVAAGTEAPEYAQHLLEAARELPGAPNVAITASAIVERSNLGDRLLALLDERLSRRALTGRAVAIATGAAFAVIATVAALQPVTRAAVVEAVRAAVAPAAAATPNVAPSPVAPTAPAIPSAAPTANAGAALEGIITGPDGRPLANALVLARPEPVVRIAVPDAVRTDAAGAFRLIPRERASSYWVHVEAPGVVHQTKTGVTLRTPVRVRLEKGSSVSGLVVDGKTRKPIARARIAARDSGVSFPAPSGEPDAGLALATTDDKGRYRLEGLGAGVHEVNASAPGYGVARRQSAAGASNADLFLFAGASISGVVTGPDRRPVAGAVVFAESELPIAPSAAPATTDEHGRFQLYGLEASSFRVYVKARGLAPQVSSGIAVDEGDDRKLDVALGPAYRLRGRLVDSERQPVEGTVRVQDFDGVEAPRSQLRTLSSDTWTLSSEAGDDGHFEIEGVPAGTHGIGIDPIGFPPKRIEATVTGKTAVVDLGDVELPGGPTIRGRVRDTRGAPIAEAFIQTEEPGRRYIRGRSGKDGTFVLRGLEPGPHDVRAQAPGFTFVIRPAEPGGAPIELVLEKSGGIAGMIVDDGGRPVAAYSVIARPQKAVNGQNTMVSPAAPIGADGRFSIEGLREGPYQITIYAEGFVPLTTPDIAVPIAGVTDAGRITLSRGGSVAGVVVDRQGQGVPGADVDVLKTRRGSSSGRERKSTKTDAAGRFELAGVSPGTVPVRASHPHYADAETIDVAVEPENGPASVRFVLSEGGRVAGVVRRRNTSDGMTLYAVTAPHDGPPFDGRHQARVNQDGTFEVEHVRPGRTDVMLMGGTGGAYHTVYGKELDVREGETAFVEVNLAETRVQGRVTRGGEPVAGADLRLAGTMSASTFSGPPAVRGSGPDRNRATTREDGSYEMIVPVPGRYSLDVSSTSRMLVIPPSMRNVNVPDEESFRLDVALPAVALSGVVLAADTQKPIARASVVALNARGEPWRVATNEDGWYELTLGPGGYEVRVAATDYVAQTATFEVAEGRTAERTFRLVRGAALKVLAVDERGQRAKAPLAVALTRAGDDIRGGRGPEDGVVDIDGLAAGEYDVFVASEVSGFGLQRVAVPGRTPLTVTLSPGIRARLQIRDETGKPLVEAPVTVAVRQWNGAVVALERGTSYALVATTDERGFVEMALPAGHVTLKGRTRDFSRTGTLELATREGVTSVLTLAPAPR